MNRLSVKLAMYFLVMILVLEGLLMMYLHPSVGHARVEEEFARQLAAGKNHSAVLSDNFSEDTMHHIVLMESFSDRGVAIYDEEGSLLTRFNRSDINWDEVGAEIEGSEYTTDTLIQSDWKDEPFIVSAHPYIADSGEQGVLVLFQSTTSIHALMDKLNFHFLLAGIVSVLILGFVYMMLSRMLTRPLVRMKVATEKLSRGEFDVALPEKSNDELGELSIAIEKLAADLQEIRKNRSDFLSSISHELRTPLTYLAGYSKVALRPDLSAEEKANYLLIIKEETARLTDLIENLFELAKLDDPSFDVNIEAFAAEPFIQGLFHRLAPSFEESASTLTYQVEPGHVIEADPLRVEQIIVNLVDNARNYSEPGSTTHLSVQSLQGRTQIQVIDQGMGIPKKQQEAIFDRLYRLEKSRSRLHGGSGLGLTIVKELVEAHGGTINVESEPGKGSTFTVVV